MSSRSKSGRDGHRDDRDDRRDRDRDRDRDREREKRDRRDHDDRRDSRRDDDRRDSRRDDDRREERRDDKRRENEDRDKDTKRKRDDDVRSPARSPVKEESEPKKLKISEEDEKLLLAIAEKKKQQERLARVQAWKQINALEDVKNENASEKGPEKQEPAIANNSSNNNAAIVTKSSTKLPVPKLKAGLSLFAGDEAKEKKQLTKLDDSLQNAKEGDRDLLLNVKQDEEQMQVEGARNPDASEEDELDDEDEIERERTSLRLKEHGDEALHMEVEAQLADEQEEKKPFAMTIEAPKKEVTHNRNKVAAWKGITPSRTSKKTVAPELLLDANGEDPLISYMRTISADFRKETESALAKAKEEAAQRGDVHIEEDEEDREAVIVKKKLIEAIDHRKQVYNEFRKDFYIPCPEINKMTPQEVSAFRKELDGIKIRGKNCPNPVKTFLQCGLKPKIVGVLERYEYTKPTPIQAQAIPAVMSGLDVIGIAKTGSGKTLAYLLPMFRHIMDQPPLDPSDGPIAIIMVPTRELAVQIHTECGKFTKVTNIRSACVYGGAGVKHQIGDLKRGAEIVVCTPGRMIDVLCANKGRVTNLKRVTFLVLDEADRMFDMGFEPQITRIIQNIRPNRQTVLFSATFPRSVEIAARKILIKPVEISIRGKGVVSDTITQLVRVIVEEDKMKVLLEYIADWYDRGNILVFVDTQESTDQLWREILKSGYTSCGSLHGGKEQLDRDFTLKEFKAGNIKILVATSVAARGLDVPLIRLVVNFDCPNHLEDYVHRCGRTGRAGVAGTAVTFLTPAQEQYSRDLVKAITASGQDVPPELAKIYNDFESKRKAGVAKKHKSQFLNVRGFKFDDTEAKQKNDLLKIQKMAHGVVAEYDINIDSDEDIDDDEEEEQVTTEALQFELMSNTKTVGGDDAGERAKLFAQDIVNKQVSKLHSSMRYSEDLEINDYPQAARWKVLQQAGMESIREMTGCGLTTKGVFVAPGRPAPAGQRKLFLFIEGNTVDEVRKAKFEIKRMLDEAVQTGRPDAQTYGKYTV